MSENSTIKFLKADEVAKMLNVHRSTIYRMVEKREIPFIVIKKKVLRFTEAAILNWINKKTVA